MNTLVYSDSNSYPGRAAGKYTAGYNFLTGTEPAILNDVNLGNNFSFNLYAGIAGSGPPTTEEDNYGGYAQQGYRNGINPQSPRFDIGSPYALVYKRITGFSWVTNLGPKGNAVAQNEKGDWFTYDALNTPDCAGTGIKLVSIPANPASADYSFTLGSAASGYVYTVSTGVIPRWPTLNINGSYNTAVFCYNQFEYTNDYEGSLFTAKSLFELPEKFDNLVSFIPDQRRNTTLTYTVKIDWVREATWNLGFSSTDKTSILSKYDDNGIGPTGTDYHTVNHTINNTFDWNKLFKETLTRQRSRNDQYARYGQTFPSKNIKVE